ncbi:MAG: YjgP/YjgQ family permease [Gemmataceae bacterium]|nr:YjgP/YjgQ family permease [Gemmataceae bacterium]
MFWGTVHRMIFIELVKVFSIALVAITGLILLAGIISEAMKNGFGPMQIIACIPLLLPSTLPYTLPPTTLFATCIVYGRLSADNEITALKSAGVHLLQVIWPALFLGTIVSAVTMYCFLDLIPTTGCLLRYQVVGDVEELLYNMLRRDGCIDHPNINVLIHVKAVHGRKLQDAIFKRRSANGDGFDVIAFAKEAELRVDLAHEKILVDMRQCQVMHGNGHGLVDCKIWPIDIPNGLVGNAVKHRTIDMTWSELREYEAKAQKLKQEINQRFELLQVQNNLTPTAATSELDVLGKELMIQEELIFAVHAEWLMRPALALGALCFALVGCPIGIWFSKSDYLSAFITCFLPIVVIYYPLMFCMYNLARAGKIPPTLAIFNADAIMLVAGAVLFRRMARN